MFIVVDCVTKDITAVIVKFVELCAAQKKEVTVYYNGRLELPFSETAIAARSVKVTMDESIPFIKGFAISTYMPSLAATNGVFLTIVAKSDITPMLRGHKVNVFDNPNELFNPFFLAEVGLTPEKEKEAYEKEIYEKELKEYTDALQAPSRFLASTIGSAASSVRGFMAAAASSAAEVTTDVVGSVLWASLGCLQGVLPSGEAPTPAPHGGAGRPEIGRRPLP